MNANLPRLVALLLLPAPLWADRLTFGNGDILTGAITGIDDHGRIVVESPDAPTPLLLRSDTLETAVFQQDSTFDLHNHERINLTNGDILPGEVTAMDGSHLAIRTWFAGDLRIPRSKVRSIDFGIAPSKLAYASPGGPEGWLEGNEWKFSGTGEKAKLVSTGRGTIARHKVLPDNFILRFTVAWTANPNMAFHFCDDHLKSTGNADRYYFEINQAGIQIKRQASEHSRTFHTLYESQRRPSTFDHNDVDVEIRVDRTRKLIYIYLDDELEGRYPDLIEDTPEGRGIMLKSNSGHEDKNMVSAIEVYHWDAISQLHRAEGHDDTTMDSLITSDSQRYPGDALELVTGNGERLIILENPHARDLIRMPVERTSVLYFRHEEDAEAAEADFSLDLFNQGLLQLSEPRLQGDDLTGHHPLLGKITIKRGALKRVQATKSDASDS